MLLRTRTIECSADPFPKNCMETTIPCNVKILKSFKQKTVEINIRQVHHEKLLHIQWIMIYEMHQ